MKTHEITASLREVGAAVRTWRRAYREFNEQKDRVLKHLLMEAAFQRMSLDEAALAADLPLAGLRPIAKEMELNTKRGRSLLTRQAAETLAANAAFLGVDQTEMDLMSPLAYLPMGSGLRQFLETEATQGVAAKMDDDERAYKGLVLLRELGFCTECLDGSTMPCDVCGAGL